MRGSDPRLDFTMPPPSPHLLPSNYSAICRNSETVAAGSSRSRTHPKFIEWGKITFTIWSWCCGWFIFTWLFRLSIFCEFACRGKLSDHNRNPLSYPSFLHIKSGACYSVYNWPNSCGTPRPGNRQIPNVLEPGAWFGQGQAIHWGLALRH